MKLILDKPYLTAFDVARAIAGIVGACWLAVASVMFLSDVSAALAWMDADPNSTWAILAWWLALVAVCGMFEGE